MATTTTTTTTTTACASAHNFRFAIDRGGTFTDVFAEWEEGGDGGGDARAAGAASGRCRALKLLSEDPENYPDAPREGIRRVLEAVTGQPHPRDAPLDASRVAEIRMGTTVATNALLERKGAPCCLVITKGFRDLLAIGNQARPRIFDLEIRRPELIYSEVVEVEERVHLWREDDTADEGAPVQRGATGEEVVVEQAPDAAMVRQQLQAVFDRGIHSVAIVLLHSYLFDEHERQVADVARSVGFTQISLSSEVMPMIKIVPRGYTTCIDAYLTPVIKDYIESFSSGFATLDGVNVSFMQSDGGLTPVDKFCGNRAILSGPAGGVVGFSVTSFDSTRQPVIGFDMGGTSTDVSRFDGTYDHVFETTTGGVTIQSPQLDINTVAAGGGSRLFYRHNMFVVGPESAGAHPGPVCYRKNGYLAVSDANLLLGRILPQYFPAIFGPNEDEPLDTEGTRAAFEALAAEVNADHNASPKTLDEIAYGFLRVANEAMCRPIRNLTTMKGYDVSSHILATFGGAGPQHCCAIARTLGIKTIKVHRYSGILSAFGLSLADVVEERQEPCATAYNENTAAHLDERFAELEEAARRALLDQGFPPERITVHRYLNMRYAGTDNAIMTTTTGTSNSSPSFADEFVSTYQREYGFVLTNRDILVDDVRVRAVGKSAASEVHQAESAATDGTPPASGESFQVLDNVSVYFQEGGRQDTPVYRLEQLPTGATIAGPAIIMQHVSTVVVEPLCTAFVTATGDIVITVEYGSDRTADGPLASDDDAGPDPIFLSILGHRFMGIAEQMGHTLQRTSISVNIKERLDFSCAIFDSEGGLVANAPHLPVHLGAMSDAVRFQVRHWGRDGMHPGDVFVSNHPQLAGGSHLPDITVITPVFDQSGSIEFFVAARGHHADIGGIAPGSMPPASTTLMDEGAAIVAFKLVDGATGEFQEEGIAELLQAPGKLPGNFGTRQLADNLSDLRAQVAANSCGVTLMQELMAEYGRVVQTYMRHIQAAASEAVSDMLRSFGDQVAERQGLDRTDKTLPVTVRAEDHLDDGSPICLAITINREQGTAVFDFEGTGPELYGNLNAPPAVTASAIIYSLRCMLTGMDIPLNQGCLEPIEIRIPDGCLLKPSAEAAVVGGNVLTSQRVCDVLFKAFGACAASQGCMNNLTFGNDNLAYYETIAGGAGAGPTWNGASGVHTHMTNTRITDPEILERRYPSILRQFSLRRGSGGDGEFRGGDGVVREIEFRCPLTVSILSERRAFQPYGLAGGKSGARGRNILARRRPSDANATTGSSDPVSQSATYRNVNLGGKKTVTVSGGDKLFVFSPGGGGYGTPTGAGDQHGEARHEALPLEYGGSLAKREGTQTTGF